jgi:hypothetical protein
MEIELYGKLQDPLSAVDRLGDWIAKSGMFGCEKLEQGKILALTCMCERISPIQFKRKYHMVQGELTQRADNMLAEFRQKLNGTHKVIARTSEVAEIELTLGKDVTRFKVSFDELKAEPFIYTKDGKTLKKNWNTPRARMQMLWARVVSDAVRAIAPEIVAGVITPEEADEEDHQEPREFKLAAGVPVKPAPVAQTTTERPKVIVAKGSASPVVDVHVTTTEVPEPAPEPKPDPAPAPIVAPVELPDDLPTKATVKDDGLLTLETVKGLMSIIGELDLQAMSCFQKWQWLKDGEPLDKLTVKRAQMILDDPQRFINKIKGVA